MLWELDGTLLVSTTGVGADNAGRIAIMTVRNAVVEKNFILEVFL
jgi:hypothetical protein